MNSFYCVCLKHISRVGHALDIAVFLKLFPSFLSPQKGLVQCFKWLIFRYRLVKLWHTCTHTHTHTHTHSTQHTRHHPPLLTAHSLPVELYVHTNMRTYVQPCTQPALLLSHSAGRANLASICDQDRSCAIVEHYGLQCGFTVAHETGHRWLQGRWGNVVPSCACSCSFTPWLAVTSHVMAVRMHTVEHVESDISSNP